MNVAENLYEYLKHNDRAEITGFGTFYVKTSSAQINELTGTIDPPKREILFTKQLSDDKAFVSFMAEKEFISEQTAYTWVKQYGDALTDKLSSGKKATIGKLGTIAKGVLDEYVFTPDEKLNLLDSSFAFSPLKNVQTFDADDKPPQVETLHTQNTSMPKEFEDKKSEIEKHIQQAKQIKQEDKITETSSQTQTRIIKHSEAQIDTDVEKPTSETQVEPLSVDATPKEDKTEQTIDRASEFNENVVVEDIKPLEASENSETSQKEDIKEDIALEKELHDEAKEIVKKHTKKHNRINKDNSMPKHNRFWKILFFVVLILIVLCTAFVICHRMGCFKDIAFLKPVTDKLSYYIPVKQDDKPVVNPQPTQTPTESITQEDIDTETLTEIPSQETDLTPVSPVANNKPTKANKTKNKKTSSDKEQTSQPVNTSEPTEVVDNTPVLTQSYSKLGFDVVSGKFADKSKAEKGARKAKRLGYDGYVLTKLEAGTPMYYVSYGSRRTLHEANDLMQSMQESLGGSYYVISR